jgi:hypothetical protein
LITGGDPKGVDMRASLFHKTKSRSPQLFLCHRGRKAI